MHDTHIPRNTHTQQTYTAIKAMTLIVIALASLHSAAHSQQTYTIAFTAAHEQSSIFKAAKQLVASVSERTKINFQLISLPPKRSLQMLKKNQIAAELYRTENYALFAKNTIKLANSEKYIYFHAYSNKKNIRVSNWNSLKKLSILEVRGWLYTRQQLPEKQFILVDSPYQAFKMLAANRADIFIADQFTAAATLQLNEFSDTEIRRLGAALGKLKLYTFFSSKHPEIAKKYDQAIKEMKEDGTLEKIMNGIRDQQPPKL